MLNVSSSPRENIHWLHVAGLLQATDEEPGPYMQLLTLPINPQDAGPADICHGRNSLVHEAIRNAVPVSGRHTTIHIKSRADGDTESSKFIMPGLHVYDRSDSVLYALFPTKSWTEDTALSSGPMPDWASGNFFLEGGFVLLFM